MKLFLRMDEQTRQSIRSLMVTPAFAKFIEFLKMSLEEQDELNRRAPPDLISQMQGRAQVFEEIIEACEYEIRASNTQRPAGSAPANPRTGKSW